MKKIGAILLVGLLAFLGCSGDDGTTTVGKANPVAPFGIIETPTPTYEWIPVPGATKYRLMVQDASETAVIEEWYTAEESGCASEDGLCMVTPDIEVFEENTWKVQACANQECGLWSESINFDFTAMNAPRFTDHGDGTVTDNKTSLMWSKDADPCGVMNWDDAERCCDSLILAGHSDWRLPDILELNSLIDPSQHYPSLPPGHPFTNVQAATDSDGYWTSYSLHPNSFFVFSFSQPPGVWPFWWWPPNRPPGFYAWCVRGGN